MLKVLWLCSWYPNNLDPFEGDFVQRHAQAASLQNSIHVIKLRPDPQAKNVTKITRTFQEWPNLTETFIYYPKTNTLLGRTVAYLRWYSLYKFAVDNYIEKNELPDLVHVHIPYKDGIIAQQIKRKFNILYVVTEHWGGYNKVIPENYKAREPRFRNVVKDTFKKASGVHSVSRYLAEKINEQVVKIDSVIMPNVVNTTYFNYKPGVNDPSKFTVIHVSNGSIEKNIEGLLDALDMLDKNVFNVIILGLNKDSNKAFRKKYSDFEFLDPMPYQLVAHYLGMADVMVMFSHIENSPCVIGEALCCGLPVIATAVGGIPELIDETNGLLIEPGNKQQLIEGIKKIRESYHSYDKRKISEGAISEFGYNVVSEQTDKWYRKILNRQD